MAGLRTFLTRAALILALLLPVYFLVAALGTRFGLLDWRIGFGVMTFRLGAPIILGVAVLALIALLLAIFVKPRAGWRSALVALLIPALGLGYGLYARARAQSIPPIHDISTDLANPPQFSPALLEARAASHAMNDVVSTPEVAAAQRAGYSDIQPIALTLAPQQAFDRALAAARALGWTITAENRDAGLIEANVRSFWYGFTDDIVVRVSAAPAGSVVDVRSVSRVGLSDLGANAARIRALRESLNETGE